MKLPITVIKPETQEPCNLKIRNIYLFRNDGEDQLIVVAKLTALNKLSASDISTWNNKEDTVTIEIPTKLPIERTIVTDENQVQALNEKYQESTVLYRNNDLKLKAVIERKQAQDIEAQKLFVKKLQQRQQELKSAEDKIHREQAINQKLLEKADPTSTKRHQQFESTWPTSAFSLGIAAAGILLFKAALANNESISAITDIKFKP